MKKTLEDYIKEDSKRGDIDTSSERYKELTQLMINDIEYISQLKNGKVNKCQ